jgi:hypothetical protein
LGTVYLLRVCRLLVTTAGMGMGVDIRCDIVFKLARFDSFVRDIALVVIVGVPTTEWKLAQQVSGREKKLSDQQELLFWFLPAFLTANRQIGRAARDGSQGAAVILASKGDSGHPALKSLFGKRPKPGASTRLPCLVDGLADVFKLSIADGGFQ